MTAYLITLAALPLAGTIAALVGARARAAGYAAIAGAVGSLILSVVVVARVVGHGPHEALSGFVYVDGLGAFFMFTLAVVVLLASLGSASYLRSEEADGTFSPLQV